MLPDIKDMIGSLNRLHRATELMDEEKLAEAAAILDPLAADVPNFFRARLNLGFCRLRQERYDEAVRWFLSALEVDPNSDRAHDMLGFTYLKLGHLCRRKRNSDNSWNCAPIPKTDICFWAKLSSDSVTWKLPAGITRLALRSILKTPGRVGHWTSCQAANRVRCFFSFLPTGRSVSLPRPLALGFAGGVSFGHPSIFVTRIEKS